MQQLMRSMKSRWKLLVLLIGWLGCFTASCSSPEPVVPIEANQAATKVGASVRRASHAPVYYVISATAPAMFRRAGPNVEVCAGTDDHVQIQAAVDVAEAAGGGIVELSVGAYSTDTLITIDSDNVTVRGAGHGTVITVADSADVGVFKIDSADNVVIENLRLEGNKANQGVAACRGVWFSDAVRGRVSGVWANDFQGGGTSETRGLGIFVDDSDYIVVENCYAKDNNYDNIGVRNGSTNCIVTGCVCVDAAGRAGIQLVNVSNITVSNNVCTGGASGGIALHGVSDSTIVGNSCYSNTGAGIHLISPDETDLTHDVTVVGNVCNDNTGVGIWVERYTDGTVDRVSLCNNTISGNSSRGIEIEAGVDRAIIKGNLCFNNVSTSINIESGATNILIAGNQLLDTQKTVNAGTVLISAAKENVTLGEGVTTFVIESNVMVVTGDAKTNTVATIAGGTSGQVLTMIFVDGLVTITDDDAHAANAVDLVGTATDFTSADDTTLTLVHTGTGWYEVSRSVN